MPDARISVAITAQVRDTGAFPSCRTYPASFERYLTQLAKVYGTTGTVGSAPATLPMADTLATVKVWYIENTGSTGDVTVAGAPLNGTVARGQCVLATNEAAGWPAANLTITGTAGATFKIIALGD